MSSIIGLFFIPFVVINALGGIVSGIWLAILGEWGLIGYGLLSLIFSGMLLGFAMAPGMLFAGPAVMFLEKGKRFLAYVFGTLSTCYTVGLLGVWCVLVLIFFASRLTEASLIPGLLWSYGVATGPIAWLASKDMQSGNEYSAGTTFFLQVAYLISIIGIAFLGFSLAHVFVVFGIVLVLALIVQSTVFIVGMRNSLPY